MCKFFLTIVIILTGLASIGQTPMRALLAKKSGYDADAQAFFTASGLSDNTQKNAINQLVLDLKAASIWTKMFAVYPFIGGTAALHKWNLKDPRDLDAAYRLVFTGTWTHSSNGALPDAATTYANTFFTPDGDFTTSSGAMGYYSRTNSSGNNVVEISRIDASANSVILIMKWSTGSGFYDMYTNGVDRVTVAGATSTKLHIASRTSTTLLTVYRDGSSIGTYTTTVAGTPPTGNVYLAANNNNGTFSGYSDRQCAFAFFSQGLNSTEVTALNTAVTNYQTTLGRQI